MTKWSLTVTVLSHICKEPDHTDVFMVFQKWGGTIGEVKHKGGPVVQICMLIELHHKLRALLMLLTV